MSTHKFERIAPYGDDVLQLPVEDLGQASHWYCKHFDMAEVSRSETQIILERDGCQIGFATNNDKNPEMEGAAIAVSDIHLTKAAIQKSGFEVGDLRIDERDGESYEVFFVVAPDGLCFYFNAKVPAPSTA